LAGIAKAGGELPHLVGGLVPTLQKRFGRVDRLVDSARAECEALAPAVAAVLHPAAGHHMEQMEAVALGDPPGHPKLARSRRRAPARLVDHLAVGLAVRRHIPEQDVEVVLLARDRAEGAAVEGPVVPADGGQQPEIEPARFVLRPFGTEIAAPLDLRREVGAGREDDRLPLVAAQVVRAPEGDELDAFRRPPAGDRRGGEKPPLAAVILAVPVESDAGRHR
jgi:hypothetical protein